MEPDKNRSMLRGEASRMPSQEWLRGPSFSKCLHFPFRFCRHACIPAEWKIWSSKVQCFSTIYSVKRKAMNALPLSSVPMGSCMQVIKRTCLSQLLRRCHQISLLFHNEQVKTSTLNFERNLLPLPFFPHEKHLSDTAAGRWRPCMDGMIDGTLTHDAQYICAKWSRTVPRKGSWKEKHREDTTTPKSHSMSKRILFSHLLFSTTMLQNWTSYLPCLALCRVFLSQVDTQLRCGCPGPTCCLINTMFVKVQHTGCFRKTRCRRRCSATDKTNVYHAAVRLDIKKKATQALEHAKTQDIKLSTLVPVFITNPLQFTLPAWCDRHSWRSQSEVIKNP